MALNSILALFSTMFVLAMIPSPSVFAVVGRAVASGFIHGAITTAGIVAGDFIFILLTLLGLWTLAETMGSVFVLVKYLGAIYLIYLGIGLWRTRPRLQEIDAIAKVSWLSNFMAGLLITLSDPKAMLFYASFLPAYVDLYSLSGLEIGGIMGIAIVAVGGAKLVYAYGAHRARVLFKDARLQTLLNGLAGIALAGTGIFLAVAT